MAKIPYQIQPQGGGTVSVTEVKDEYDFATYWTDTFTATPADGFVFDRWEYDSIGQDRQIDRDNPMRRSYMEMSGGGASGTTLVIAVFRRPHVPTGLIWREPGGLILRGPDNLGILRDA